MITNLTNKKQLFYICLLLTAIAVATVNLYAGGVIILLAFLTAGIQIRTWFLFHSATQHVNNLLDNEYEYPPKTLLKIYKVFLESKTSIMSKQRAVVATLKKFNVAVLFVEAKKSPTITQLRFQLENIRNGTKTASAKLTQISSRQNDIRLALKTNTVNFIPIVEGTNCFGIEIPNKKQSIIGLLNVINENLFKEFIRKLQIKVNDVSLCNGLPIAAGYNIEGLPLYFDLVTAPHLLISGATNSGKTSLIHTIINSLLFYHSPDTLQLYLVDGKTTELTLYEKLPHLQGSILTSFEQLNEMLNTVMEEIIRRNVLLKNAQKRNIISYNQVIKDEKEFLPYIVIIIDEFAEITMQNNARASAQFSEFENTISRIGQLARSAGIHLILSTQRPDSNVITPLLKANIPTRVCYKVTDKTNSMVVIDKVGGELLTGNGDGYLLLNSALQRFQTVYLEDYEILNVVNWWQTV